MARPIKNSCDYFPHDGDMRNHRKVKAIITRFGLIGYANWSMLLEVLTTSENFTLKLNTEIDWELLASELHISNEKLKEFISYLLTLSLLKNEDNNYWSESLIKRFSSLLNKRIRAKKAFEECKEIELKIGKKIQSSNGINRATRLVVYENCDFKCTKCSTSDADILDVHHIIERHKGGSDEPDNLILLCANCHRKEHSTQVSVAETQIKTPENTQSKVKESKVKKTIEERKVAFGLSLKEFENTYSRTMLTAFYNYWIELTPSGNKMKFELEQTWETHLRLAKWDSNEKKFKPPQVVKPNQQPNKFLTPDELRRA